MNDLTRIGKIKRSLRNFLKSESAKRLMVFSVIMMFFCFETFASDAAVTGMNNVSARLKSYIGPIQTIIYMIAAAVGMAGIVRIFIKMQSGDQDVQKSIVMFLGGVLFLVATATALPAIFGAN